MKRVLIIIATLSMVAAPIAASEKYVSSVDRVPDSYIVVLNPVMLEREQDSDYKKAVQEVALSISESYPMTIQSTWHYALQGFAATMTEATARVLASHPTVLLVEENAKIYVAATRNTDWTQRNLDRIDQRNGLDNTYSHDCDGFAVWAYVVDTGVLQSHQEFTRADGSSRVYTGADFAPSDGYNQIYPG